MIQDAFAQQWGIDPISTEHMMNRLDVGAFFSETPRFQIEICNAKVSRGFSSKINYDQSIDGRITIRKGIWQRYQGFGGSQDVWVSAGWEVTNGG